ncbi:unnamed protein product [Cuscuta europaea]|uniref:glucan endo-1,3-beta-D-glucosidase n=1 Tax=Cuscuta europaea TaxID=41803 RepID=A0A9P0YLJ7_CUSEU|nr:unnamed protein product [Cuscuta europaea]
MNVVPRRITIVIQLLGFYLLIHGLHREVEGLGINYGQLGDNLLPPARVVQLLQACKFTKVRIYDTNPQILTAFANTGIELIVTVENAKLAGFSADPQQANQWVAANIQPYFPATKITGIAVGNEVITAEDTSSMGNLVPAMRNIHAALVALGFDPYIKVSSPHSLAVMGSSYPPSGGRFKPELATVMTQFIQFLVDTQSPFWINAYPYFAYKDSPDKISLDYVLFNAAAAVAVDPVTNLKYNNMLYAQVDAVLAAIYMLGFNRVEVRVSETGWPSAGDANEVGATPQNAQTYNRNLVRRQMLNEGTPLRPGMRLEIYLFALFNEDSKPGPTSERNYGLFLPNGVAAYDIGLLATTSPSSATISLSSSAAPIKVEHMKYQRFMYMMIIVLMLGWQVL